MYMSITDHEAYKRPQAAPAAYEGGVTPDQFPAPQPAAEAYPVYGYQAQPHAETYPVYNYGDQQPLPPVEAPTPYPLATNEKKGRRAHPLALAAGAAGMVAMGFGIKLGLPVMIHDNDSAPLHPDKTASATPFRTDPKTAEKLNDPDTNHNGHIDKDEFLAMPDPTDAQHAEPGDLTEAFSKDFDGWRRTEFDNLNNNGLLNEEQLKVLSVPSSNIPKEQWDNQMIVNGLTLDIADAVAQSPASLGYLMLPAVEDPGVWHYGGDEGHIGTDAAIINVYKAAPDVITLKKNTFMGVPINPKTARVILGTLVRNEKYTDKNQADQVWMLVDLQTGTDGTSKQYRLKGEWNAYGDDNTAIQVELSQR
jgi:hypothetical protein